MPWLWGCGHARVGASASVARRTAPPSGLYSITPILVRLSVKKHRRMPLATMRASHRSHGRALRILAAALPLLLLLLPSDCESTPIAAAVT